MAPPSPPHSSPPQHLVFSQGTRLGGSERAWFPTNQRIDKGGFINFVKAGDACFRPPGGNSLQAAFAIQIETVLDGASLPGGFIPTVQLRILTKDTMRAINIHSSSINHLKCTLIYFPSWPAAH